MDCKLTDSKYQTHGGTQWGENVTHEATGRDKELCTNGWIHYYDNPYKAVLFNIIHAKFSNPVLWEVKAEGKKTSDKLKCGCRKLTTIKQIPLPEISTEKRVAFAIRCAKQIYKDKKWNEWADNWLNGTDRSQAAANAAADAAYAANATYATYAARAAADAARAANAGANIDKAIEETFAF